MSDYDANDALRSEATTKQGDSQLTGKWDEVDRVAADLSPIALRIKQLREARGMSQRQLARAAQVGVNVISQLEAGNTQAPEKDNIIAIAQALRVDPFELKELAGLLTVEERLAFGRLPSFHEFIKSRHLPLTERQREGLVLLYNSYVGRS